MARLNSKIWQEVISRINRKLFLRIIGQFDVEVSSRMQKLARSISNVASKIPNARLNPFIRRMFYYSQLRPNIYTQLANFWFYRFRSIFEKYRDAEMEIIVHQHEQVLGHLIGDSGFESFVAQAVDFWKEVINHNIIFMDVSNLIRINLIESMSKVDKAVIEGVKNKNDTELIASNVFALFDPRIAGGISYQSLRLGRTELAEAFHNINNTICQMTPWETGGLWNVSKSHGSKDICNDLARKTFVAGSIPPLPHPLCLCYTTTITVDESTFTRKLNQGTFDHIMA